MYVPADMMTGLTAEEREWRIAAIAAGINHWAIPSDEKLHLLITAHHGHRQGANKCKGDKAPVRGVPTARTPQRRDRPA